MACSMTFRQKETCLVRVDVVKLIVYCLTPLFSIYLYVCRNSSIVYCVTVIYHYILLTERIILHVIEVFLGYGCPANIDY